ASRENRRGPGERAWRPVVTVLPRSMSWVAPVEHVAPERAEPGARRVPEVPAAVVAPAMDPEEILVAPERRVVVVGALVIDAPRLDEASVEQHRADLPASRIHEGRRRRRLHPEEPQQGA